MRRAFVVVLGTASFALGAIIVACSFPDPTFAPDQQFQDGSFVPDSNTQDTSPPVGDGGSDADDPQQCPDICDCDGDGDKNTSCPAGPGGDCDDRDPFVSSDAGFTERTPLKRDGDWNCNGNVEMEWDSGLTCAKALTPSLDAAVYVEECTHEGFAEPRTNLVCGEAASWVQCEWNGSIAGPVCREKAGSAQNKIVKCK